MTFEKSDYDLVVDAGDGDGGAFDESWMKRKRMSDDYDCCEYLLWMASKGI